MMIDTTTHSTIHKNGNLKNALLLIISLMQISFSYADEEQLINPEPDIQTAEKFFVNYNCKTLDDIELRVFHSLYYTKEKAEQVFELISSIENKDQLKYLNISADADSLDPGSRGKGGDLGYSYYGFYKNTNSSLDINKVLYELPIDKLSPPTQSEFGWHLFWVSEARDINTKAWCNHAYWQSE